MSDDRYSLKSTGRRIAVVLAASSAAVFVPSGSGVVFAHCVGSSTSSSSTAYASQYNLNANTCNGDLIYTGRFDDLSSTYNNRMAWDLEQDGVYDGTSVLSSGTGTGYQWTYSDSNSASYFRFNRYNSGGTLVATSSQGTNSGY